MATENKAIGIDLGTCYSCVAVYHDKRVQIIANNEGNKIAPCMVAFTSRERLIGDAAKNQFTLNPQNTIFDTKRLIGRCFNDDSVQKDMALWPFKVVCGKNNKPRIEVEYKGSKRTFAAEEISSMVLCKMKGIAEAYLNSKVTNAVITVPVYFNDSQRQATKNAATIAGLHAMQVINEPTAAAIAYGLDTKTYSSSEKKILLVFDLGGGTLDISLLSIVKGTFQVLAVHGDTHLGGQDFDNILVEYCAKQFEVKSGKNITQNARSLRRLRTACERAKRSLSSSLETLMEIDCLCDGIDFFTKITRTKFELLNDELFGKCMKSVEKCLDNANMKVEEVHKVVLVGGSTRIPRIREMIQELFGQKVLCNSINPDEAVAYGAAVQAAVMSGNRVDLTVIDVTPLSLGLGVKGGLMSVVIPKNTPIPTRKEDYVLTTKDDQTSASVYVYQGERSKVEDNNLLGDFTLNGIPAAPAGDVRIKICFDIDGSGILKVSAEHKTTGLKNEIVINCEDVGGLNKEEMERMLVDAERFMWEDEKSKENAAAREALEDYYLKMKKRVTKAKLQGKMEMKEIEDIEKGIEEAVAWVDMIDENTEAHRFEEKLEELKITYDGLTPTSPKSLTVTSPRVPDQRSKSSTEAETLVNSESKTAARSSIVAKSPANSECEIATRSSTVARQSGTYGTEVSKLYHPRVADVGELEQAGFHLDDVATLAAKSSGLTSRPVLNINHTGPLQTANLGRVQQQSDFSAPSVNSVETQHHSSNLRAQSSFISPINNHIDTWEDYVIADTSPRTGTSTDINIDNRGSQARFL